MGDSIYTNPIMLGYAWQRGWLPLSRASLLRAIELNAVAVDSNKAAFEWGRRAAHDSAAVQKLLNPGQVIAFSARKQESLDDTVQTRVEFLTAYQNAAYAGSYRDFVRKVQQAETDAVPGSRLPLTRAVARYLFKLMAYKDEYEVARLHSDPAFLAKVHQQFEGDFTLRHHLAPPLFARRNERRELQKQVFGSWIRVAFRLLAPLKVLRGGPLDVFGFTHERRHERALVQRYREAIQGMLNTLRPDNVEAATAFARVPEHIRGFGHVKARYLEAALVQWDVLLAQYRNPVAARQARAA
jgi:indolepyruvate ferredoxin oxidoreductase